MARASTAPPIEKPATPQPAAVHEPTHAEIEERAYLRYLERGRADGFDLDDWCAAEDELRHDIEVPAASV